MAGCHIHELRNAAAPLLEYRTGISLHAHTFHSKETLGFLPDCASRLPIVSRLMSTELQRFRERRHATIDFTAGFWRPPLPPGRVMKSEQAQISDLLQLPALVSITDHDTIGGCMALRRGGAPDVPISLEWTAPFQTAFVHVGLHNLPQGQAHAIMRTLAQYTSAPSERRLGEILDWIGECPETLIVLNHPFWDLESAGAAAHRALVLAFAEQHGHRLHALELNGLQTPENNRLTRQLADSLGLPLVSGGDRHGCAPNAMLNLTRAATFGEFVAEVRHDGESAIVVTPAYHEALLARRLEMAGDVLRTYPDHEAGRPHWTDRICYERYPGALRRLSQHWTDGGPLWLRGLARAVDRLTGRRAQPLLRLLLAGAQALNTWEPRHEWHSSPIRSTR